MYVNEFDLLIVNIPELYLNVKVRICPIPCLPFLSTCLLAFSIDTDDDIPTFVEPIEGLPQLVSRACS